MKKIKISVIIPVYNTEKYLERCLNAILNQDIQEIEIIIVNDSSPDNSLETIKKYMELDKRIFLINKKINEGVSEARNSGIKIAKGEYLIFIDSDDWIEEGCFKNMYETARKNKADVVISDFYREEGDNVFYENDQEKNNILTNIQSINNILLKKGWPCIWNKLIKREIFQKNNILFPNKISIGEDLIVLLKVLYFSKKIIKLNKAYLHYIQNENSITKKATIKKVFDIYEVLNILENFFEQKNMILTKGFKVSQLNWLYSCEYDLTNDKYIEILEYYLTLIKKIKLKEILSKKSKMIACFLKIFNNKYGFLILWKINNFMIQRGKNE